MNTNVKTGLFGGALLGAGLCSWATADTIEIDGTLFQSSSYYGYVFHDFAISYGSTSIDTFSFSVLSDGNVQFDMLSYRISSDWIDPIVFVFADDGNPLGSSNLLGFNDDNNALDTNGSVSNHDSFLDIFLTAGDYTIAVGSFSTFVSEVAGGMSAGGVVYNDGGRDADQGQYHLDIIGDVNTVNVVPLPPAAFAGLGMLAGIGAYRRVRR